MWHRIHFLDLQGLYVFWTAGLTTVMCQYVLLELAGMPGSFYGMVQGVTHSTSFEEAVRQGILAAGDNCSRNNFIGAYAAAR